MRIEDGQQRVSLVVVGDEFLYLHSAADTKVWASEVNLADRNFERTSDFLLRTYVGNDMHPHQKFGAAILVF